MSVALESPDVPRRIRTAEPDAPSQTYHYDWINMAPLPDQSIRIYNALRMFIFDKNPDWTVSLTDEEIGRFTPQGDGKPRSRWSVARAMKPLFDMGLVVEVETERVSVKVPGKAKPEVRTIRTLLVRTTPPGGWEQYTGPINPFRERERMAAERRKAQQARRTGKPAAQTDGADLLRHKEEAPEPEVDDVSAGQCDGADLLSKREQICSETGADLPRIVSNPRELSPENAGDPSPAPPTASAVADAPKPRSSRSRGRSKPKPVGDHQRARANAGPIACAALDANPDITISELTRLVTENDLNLSQGQAHCRALRLKHNRPDQAIEEAS